MNFTQTSAPAPALTRNFGGLTPKASKYPFATMQDGTGVVTTDFVDAKKTAARLTSAVASYRKRSGDARKFTVRTFKQEDGSDAVGVWVSAAEVAQAA